MSHLRRSMRLWVPAAAVAAMAIARRARRRRRRTDGDGAMTAGAAETGVAVPEADRIEQHQPPTANRVERPDLDTEASEGDLIEQGQPVAADSDHSVAAADVEAPEADALEQATGIESDDDRR